MKLKCIGCNRTPDQIQEYRDIIKVEDEYESCDDFVIRNEGTLNRMTGEFACTECYIKMNMPLGIACKEWKELLR